jgi:hypothetical protein
MTPLSMGRIVPLTTILVTDIDRLGHMQPYAAVCSRMQPHAAVCSHMQPYELIHFASFYYHAITSGH